MNSTASDVMCERFWETVTNRESVLFSSHELLSASSHDVPTPFILRLDHLGVKGSSRGDHHE